MEGATLPVTEGTLDQILAGADREARRTAWEGYRDTFLAHKNTLASNLATSIKQNVFQMRAGATTQRWRPHCSIRISPRQSTTTC